MSEVGERQLTAEKRGRQILPLDRPPHAEILIFFSSRSPSCWILFFFLPSPLLPWQLPAREIGLVFEYPVKMKYILVSGGEFFLSPPAFRWELWLSRTSTDLSSGVISGVGKGIIASSCGLLLKTLGLTVSSIKVDPYLNIDAGLMSYVHVPFNSIAQVESRADHFVF